MPPRRRARVSIPDTAGLSRDGQEVGRQNHPWSTDPWGDDTMPILKTWRQSFEDPDDAPSTSEPNGPDYWFRADMSDVDFDVHFRLGVTDEGGLVVTGLLLGDPGGTQAITTSNLHRLPIGAIYEAISRLDDVTTAVAEKARKFKGEVPARGGQRTPDEQFQEAAEIYRQCLIERPNDPVKCVAEKLGVSNATASRRVSRARDLGLLAEKAEALDYFRDLIPALKSRVALATKQLERLDRRMKNEPDQSALEELSRRRHNLSREITDDRVKLFEAESRLGIPITEREGIPF
jgi:hypothetical protein